MPAKKNLVMTSVRLPRDMHHSLRTIAFNRRASLQSLLIEGAKAMLDKYETSEDSPVRRSMHPLPLSLSANG
jgi:hypothetical protein